MSRILRARQGTWDDAHKAWQLHDGIDYRLDADGVYHDSQPFKTQYVAMSRYPAQLLRYGLKKPMDMHYEMLRRYIRLLKKGGQLQDVGRYEVRLHQKFALPLVSVLFALLGATLGIERIRTQNHWGLITGAAIVLLYTVGMSFATDIGGSGLLSAPLLAWFPLTLIAMITLCFGVWRLGGMRYRRG